MVLRGSMLSECENTVVYIFRGQNLIDYDERKISSEFENFRVSVLPTAEGKKSQKRNFFRFLTLCRWQHRYPKIFKLAGKFSLVIIRFWPRKIYRPVFSHSESIDPLKPKILHRLNMGNFRAIVPT